MYGFSSTAYSNSTFPKSITGLQMWIDIQFGNLIGTGAAGKAIDRSGHSNSVTTAQIARATNQTAKNGTITLLRPSNTSATISLGTNITLSNTMTFFFVGQGSTNTPMVSGSLINHVSTNGSQNLVVTDGTNTATSVGTITGSPTGTWAAVCTGAASAVSFYLNGVLDSSSGTVSMGSASGTMNALFHDHATTTFGGAFCEVLIYNTALNATQISQLHRYAQDRWLDNS